MTDDLHDAFATSDAAYVLGVLDLPDRRAFELHLQTCDRCVASVASLRHLPDLMAGYEPAEVSPATDIDDEPPATLLPDLLSAIARQRRRQRLGLALAAVTTLAACVVAIIVLASSGTSSSHSAHPVAMAALTATPVRATAELSSVAWGTRIDLRCSYAEGTYAPGLAYGLVVIDRSNVAHQLGNWQLVPGKDTFYTSGTSLAQADIAEVEITTSAGRPVLQLTL